MQPASSIPKELQNRKLYAADFQALGIEYLASVRTFLDKTKIIPPKPYPAKWKSYLELLHEDWAQRISCQYHAPVYLKYVNPKVGFGVFADSPIKRFEAIGEYTGLLCVEDDSKCEESFDYAIDAGYYASSTSEDRLTLYIDAAKCGNFTRFINHSYIPNVNAHTVFSNKDGLWHVMYRAIKDIGQDSQLLVNYGTDYWTTRNIEPVDLTANP